MNGFHLTAFFLGVAVLCIATSSTTASKYPASSDVYKRWYAMLENLSATCKVEAEGLEAVQTGNQLNDCAGISQSQLMASVMLDGCSDEEYYMMRDAVCGGAYPESSDVYKRWYAMLENQSATCKAVAKEVEMQQSGKQSKDCAGISQSPFKAKVMAAGCTEKGYNMMRDAVCSGVTAWVSCSLVVVCLLVNALKH